MIRVATLVLVRNGRVLAEKRPEDDELASGELCFPSGHARAREPLEKCVGREAREELGVKVLGAKWFAKFVWKKKCELNYFAVTKWKGRIRRGRGVGKLVWLGKRGLKKMDYWQDEGFGLQAMRVAREARRKN